LRHSLAPELNADRSRPESCPLAIRLHKPLLMSLTFSALGLSPDLLGAIGDAGYEAPTAIQARTIPALLAGRDVIGQAQTGTGKTAAFALPILQRLDVGDVAVQALVLTPTRELAIQVAEAIHTYSKRMGHVRALPVYGGSPMSVARQCPSRYAA
jgi:ATP-dependent RNA helicase DeaD